MESLDVQERLMLKILTGEKGKGGTAASNLGIGRKGSPCLTDILPGSTTLLADIQGCGVINHIWITVDDRTSDGDCFVLRDLVIKMTWDDREYAGSGSTVGRFFLLWLCKRMYCEFLSYCSCSSKRHEFLFFYAISEKSKD